MVRLRWLAGRTSVPEVRHFVAAGDAAWLLMTELPGGTAAEEFRESGADRIAIVDALVLFLRHFHALPPDACLIKSGHHLNILLQEGKVVGVIDVARVGNADR